MRYLVILSLVAAFAAGDFLDDFESYNPGDDPGDSYHWTAEPTGGHVLVTEHAGGQVVQAFFPDSAFIAYICQGAGIWDNGMVSMDFSPDGSGSLTNVFARMQLLSGEGYIAGVMVLFHPFTYAYIGYISASGQSDLLWMDYGPSVPPGAWYNVALLAEGDDPVTLTLLINGEQSGQVQDSQYRLGPGLSGFAIVYEEEQPLVLADNFSVLLSPQALQAATFAAIKRAFF